MESFHCSINLAHSFKRNKKKKKKGQLLVLAWGTWLRQRRWHAPPTSRYMVFLAQAGAKEGHGATGQRARLPPGESLLAHAGRAHAEENSGLEQSRWGKNPVHLWMKLKCMKSFSRGFLWSCPSLKQCSPLPDREGKFRPGVQTGSAVVSAPGGQLPYCLGSGAGLP